MGRCKLMKKRKRRNKTSRSKYSRRELIRLEMSTIKAKRDEVAVENVDVAAVMDMDEVGGPMMTTIKEEKAHLEVVGEELQNQGMISHESNATTVRSLDIMLPNVELLAIVELKRRPTMLKKEAKKTVHCCWHIRRAKEVGIINGILTVEQATICADEEACSWS